MDTKLEQNTIQQKNSISINFLMFVTVVEVGLFMFDFFNQGQILATPAQSLNDIVSAGFIALVGMTSLAVSLVLILVLSLLLLFKKNTTPKGMSLFVLVVSIALFVLALLSLFFAT